MDNFTWKEFFGLFIHLAGFVIGLGAVTVIDFHGFLGRKSVYWTEATTRTHKVTKPLIWLGMILAILGAWIFHSQNDWSFSVAVQAVMALVLIANGLFLSFSVSPFLLRREREGRSAELLPPEWQKKIAVAFVLSFAGWWGALLLTVYQVLMRR
jgi:prepilin signal peptidase PulO-like enzyme (type II secretory pathway)